MIPDGPLLAVNTASGQQSVWQHLNYDQFRTKVVALERASKEVPREPKFHQRNEWSNPRICNDDSSRLLPFEVEQQVADDFAFLAAAEEGAKGVSAVGLEESIEPLGLVIRLAANGPVPQKVAHTFKAIFDLLHKCAIKKLSRQACEEDCFEQVIILSEERLHGRLKSTQWTRPQHIKTPQKPLYQELRDVSRELANRLLSTERVASPLIPKLNDLCIHYQRIEKPQRDMRAQLKQLVRKSYDLCTFDGSCSLEETLRKNGLAPHLVLNDRRIQQVNKIGRYWGLCVYLTKYARAYGKIFKNLSLEILTPYEDVKSSIAYEEGSRVSCFVHAEIQLVTFYGLHGNDGRTMPRILGVSKAACYLCSLFILSQGRFFVTQSHGRLYDQWNIPDLATYDSSQLDENRRVLKMMIKGIKIDIGAQKGMQNRRYPLTSSVHLPQARKIVSPLASDLRTLTSDSSTSTHGSTTIGHVQPVEPQAGQRASGSHHGSPPVNAGESSSRRKHAPSPLPQLTLRPPSPAGSVESNPVSPFPKPSPEVDLTSPSPIEKSPPFFSNESAISTIILDQPPTTTVQPISLPQISPFIHQMAIPHTDLGASAARAQSTNPSAKPTDWLHRHSTSPSSPNSSPIDSLPPNLLPLPIINTSPQLPILPPLSSSTITSTQFPFLRLISATSPLRISSGKLRTEITFEGPGQGRVLVQRVSNPSKKSGAAFVDVRSLLPGGEPVRVEQGDADEFAVVLRNKGDFLRIDLKWV